MRSRCAESPALTRGLKRRHYASPTCFLVERERNEHEPIVRSWQETQSNPPLVLLGVPEDNRTLIEQSFNIVSIEAVRPQLLDVDLVQSKPRMRISYCNYKMTLHKPSHGSDRVIAKPCFRCHSLEGANPEAQQIKLSWISAFAEMTF